MTLSDRTADGAATPSGRSRLVGRVVGSPHIWAVAAIVGLLCINLSKDSGYLSITYSSSTGAFVGNLVDIARAVAPLLVISTGMCLVIATGGIDLSVGSMMAVSGAVAMEYMSGSGVPASVGAAAIAILLAVLLCAVLGAVNGVLISVVGLQPFITTLVMMLAGRGLAKVITSGQNTTAVNEHYRWIANGHVLGVPVVLLTSIGVAGLVGLIIRRSALGMMIESIGINPEASRLAGLNRRAILITVYVVSAFLAGIAGIFSTATVMTVDVSQTGYQFELDAILAVVIGGTSLAGGKFSLSGAALGAVLIATLDKTVVFLGIPASATPAFKATVIIVLYLAQSPRFRSSVAKLRRRGTHRAPGVAAS